MSKLREEIDSHGWETCQGCGFQEVVSKEDAFKIAVQFAREAYIAGTFAGENFDTFLVSRGVDPLEFPSDK